MSSYIDADYDQSFLFPPSLEDFLGPDHPARFVREFVESIEINAYGLIYEPGNVGKGSRPYSPRLLLRAWIYGYMNSIRSTRKLEKACVNDIGMIWLVGMHRPDHNTLWRFWDKNRKLIKSIFSKSVKVAMKMGLVDMVCHALDGTKIMSVGSKETAINKSILEKRLGKLNAAIEELLAETAENENKETEVCRLKEELCEKKELKRQIEENLKILEGEGLSNLHKVETDARMMKFKSDNKEMGYNSQAVVDEKKGIIVAEDVVQDENDSQLLNKMYDKAEEELGQNAEANLADSGYYTESEIRKAEEKGLNVLLNRNDRKSMNKSEFHKSHFDYDEQEDAFICPHTGEKLKKECVKKNNKQGKKVTVFRCKNITCPLRNQCSKDKQGKSIDMSEDYIYKQRHDKKIEEEKNKEIMKKRGPVVELAFAHIKEHAKFRRFSFMNLEKVKVQWSFVCAIQNIKKIYNAWLDLKKEAMAMAMSVAKEAAYFLFVTIFVNLIKIRQNKTINFSW